MLDLFDAVAPHLGGALCDAGARDRARAAVPALDGACLPRLFLECRLAPREARAMDVSLLAHPEHAAALHGIARAHAARTRAHASRAWAGLARLATAWPHAGAMRGIGRLWVELDVPGRGLPSAGVFVEWAPGAEPSPTQPADVLALLDDREWSDRARAGIARACDALPAGARLVYAGAFPGRAGPRRARLCVTGLDADGIVAFAARAGWPGPSAHLARMLEAAARTGMPHALPGVVSVDVGDEPGPRLGLEYACHRGAQRAGVLAEGRFLDWLVDESRATPAACDALVAWPGLARARAGGPAVLERRVSHVKLTLASDGDACTTSAKAYLAVTRHDTGDSAPTRVA